MQLYGFCFDAENLEMQAGESWFQVRLYTCQDGNGVTCENTIPVNALYFNFQMFYNKIDVTNFNEPISLNNNQISNAISSKDTRYR